MWVHNHKLKEILEGFTFEDNEELDEPIQMGRSTMKGSKANTTKAVHRHIDDTGNFS